MWCAGKPGPWPWKRFEPRLPELDDGHALTGPVAIRGARAGMTLEISIDAVIPGDWGWTWSWPQGQRARDLGVDERAGHVHRWDLNAQRSIATNETGRRINLRPFMGVMGVAPPEPGVHSTTPPRIWGGNMDCKELIAGATLYLPIGVDQALFSVGDGHGAQGDGEVCGTAIECPMEQVDLTFRMLDSPLKAPRAKTADAWITLGFDADLNRASIMALNGMLDLIQEQYRVERPEALALASLAADLRITQIVNQVQGVHCVLPHNAIQ